MTNRKKPDPKRDRHTPHPGKATRVEKETSVEKRTSVEEKDKYRRKRQV